MRRASRSSRRSATTMGCRTRFFLGSAMLRNRDYLAAAARYYSQQVRPLLDSEVEQADFSPARTPSFGPAGCLIDMDSSPDLIERAQAGDEAAFRQLVDAHRNELHLHCYRMLGSFHDAEDALQEALIAAWRGLRTFERRSSIRTWLYRVATSRCLNILRSGRARAREEGLIQMQPTELPQPTRLGEVLWIEPYPDALIDRIADRTPGPEAHYQTTEAVSLAFI